MQDTIQIPGGMAPEWSLGRKIVFRFFFIFYCIYIFPYLIDIVSEYVPALEHIGNVIVLWVGKHILHIGYKISTEPTGSGDTTYDYVFLFICISLALIGCTLWSIADRNRKSYPILNKWFIVYLRYFLAAFMLIYGFMKLTQFPAPNPMRLSEPLGLSSPMGLLWTFMGFSKGYTFFAATAEILAGTLLLFRRTTLLGAIITVGVMSNVFAMNLFYDVPVKLFSGLLILTACIIMSGQLGRLLNFFILNKPTQPVIYDPYFSKKWLKYSRWVVKTVFIGGILFLIYLSEADYLADSGHPPFYGVYNVESFVKNADTIPALLTDTFRWNKFAVTDYGSTIKLMNDRKVYFAMQVDTARKTIAFSERDTTKKSVLHYEEPDTNHLYLAGKLKGDSIIVKLKRIDYTKYPLMARGFHWVSEQPFNL